MLHAIQHVMLGMLILGTPAAAYFLVALAVFTVREYAARLRHRRYCRRIAGTAVSAWINHI
jgi:hypothetical protein